jgi:hypothetical protein
MQPVNHMFWKWMAWICFRRWNISVERQRIAAFITGTIGKFNIATAAK